MPPTAPVTDSPDYGTLALALLAALLLVAALLFFLRRARASRLPPTKEPGAAVREEVLPPGPPQPPAPPKAKSESGAPSESVPAVPDAQRMAGQLLERVRATEEEADKKAADERKKAEYWAQKERTAAEREAKRRAAEEERERAEELERARQAAEEEARRAAEEERRRKVAAEGGRTLAEGLAKTRGGFIARLDSLFGRGKVLDESVLAELEEVLVGADIGIRTATELLDFARNELRAKELKDAERLKEAIRGEIARIVGLEGLGAEAGSIASAAPALAARPHVIMVVGVNGSGKTTTVGKLASRIAGEGKRVVLAAADTFRAAATEQLEIWGERAGMPVVKGREGSDPGAIVFDAVRKGQAEGADYVLCDTAGRLHTKAPLMEELKRVKRVLEKAMPGAPHETLLVLDSTNGQNAIAQAREFHAALTVDGIVLTKLDGTAKGGVIIGICDELKVPVRFVGVGETAADLKPFDPKDYVAALFG